MSVPVGVGLVLGGGGALYLSPSLPAETKQAAQIGGVVAVAVGAWMIYQAVKDGGGLIGSLGSFIGGGDKPLVDPEQQLVSIDVGGAIAGPNTSAGADPSKPMVISMGGEVMVPARDGAANPGIWKDSYPMTVRLFNATGATIKEKLIVQVEEVYTWGGSESAAKASDLISVAPHSEMSVDLDVPIGGGRVRFSEAYATAVVRWGSKVIDTISYRLTT